MAEIKIHDVATPAEQVVAKAMREVEVVDARGRKIMLRKPGVLAQYRMVEAIGPEAAENRTYMGMVMPLIYVVAIDGNPAPPPANKDQIEALIQRLDEDGLQVVMSAVVEDFGAPNPGADKAKIKNA